MSNLNRVTVRQVMRAEVTEVDCNGLSCKQESNEQRS